MREQEPVAREACGVVVVHAQRRMQQAARQSRSTGRNMRTTFEHVHVPPAARERPRGGGARQAGADHDRIACAVEASGRLVTTHAPARRETCAQHVALVAEAFFYRDLEAACRESVAY